MILFALTSFENASTFLFLVFRMQLVMDSVHISATLTITLTIYYKSLYISAFLSLSVHSEESVHCSTKCSFNHNPMTTTKHNIL